jgi:hypothetical protein
MTNTSIAANLHQPADVLTDFLAQITFDPALVLNDLADPPRLVLGEILDPGRLLYLGLLQDLSRPRSTDTVNVRQSDPDVFILGKVHSRNSSHLFSLPLALLVFRILADHPHHAISADDLTLRTHSLHR